MSGQKYSPEKTRKRRLDESESDTSLLLDTEPGVRTDYLTFPETFMAGALLFAKRSKDPVTRVGAVIHDDENRITAFGYNGMPYQTADNADTWDKDTKRNIVCHAEMNAMLHKSSVSVKGCTMYVTLFPCQACTNLIIQSKISKLIYRRAKTTGKHQKVYEQSCDMLKAAGVKMHLYSEYAEYLTKQQKTQDESGPSVKKLEKMKEHKAVNLVFKYDEREDELDNTAQYEVFEKVKPDSSEV